jgi:hypothetical protein
MTRTGCDWDDAATDVVSYFHERTRTFNKNQMLAVIDDLALRETVTQAEMIQKHGSPDFIATTVGHVTTAIHGRGSVPKQDGWYQTADNPHTYYVNPAFAAAWRARRRLPKPE